MRLIIDFIVENRILRIICYLLISAVTGFNSGLYGGKLARIDVNKLPDDPGFISQYNALLELEPKVESYYFNWPFETDKDSVITALKGIYNGTEPFAKSDASNGELFLYRGLIATFGYNLDTKELWENAEPDYKRAMELLPDDIRPLWYLATFYIISLQNKKSMEMYHKAAQIIKEDDWLFWQGYAYAAYQSGMFCHYLMTQDKANLLLGKKSELDESIGKVARGKFIYPERDSDISPGWIWGKHDENEYTIITSYPLGYKIGVPKESRLFPYMYQKQTAMFNIKLPSEKGYKRNMVPNIFVFTYAAKDNEKLDDFMKVYDPKLIGWGIDWWYLDFLAPGIKGKVAIIDKISCVNPTDRMKGGRREIDSLQETPERIKNWEKIKEQYNIRSEAWGTMEFDSIKSPLDLSNIIRAITILSIQVICKWGRKIKNLSFSLKFNQETKK